MSEVRCKKHDWHTEHVECAACVAEKMAVYDAAMAALETGTLEYCVSSFIDDPQRPMEDVRQLLALLNACRRAKEESRG